MKRVNVVGYYGWDNFGDDLFRVAVKRNRELIWGPGARVRSFVTPIRALHQNLGVVGQATRLAETLVGALWADTIALCGGSVLEDVQGNQRVRDRLLRGRRAVEALGVSLGPWKSESAMARVRGYVLQMERVVVREQASKDRIGESVAVGGDLAALYAMPTIPPDERDYLTVCISRDSGATVDELVTVLGALLPRVDIKVKFLSLNVRRGHGDIEFTRSIYSRVRHLHPEIELVKYESLDQTIDVIAHSRAVWSQRLHGIIVAYLCEVPFIALSHHQKITDFARHIGLAPRFLRESLIVDDELRAVAEDSITSSAPWTMSPTQYRKTTIDALRTRAVSGSDHA